jgi:hypothetical protein
MSQPSIAIVPGPFDPETTDQPFGQRWGGQVARLGSEHIAALQAGQTLALDVQGEYVVFVQLSESRENTP